MTIFAGMSTIDLQAALTAAQTALIELQTGKAAATLSYTQGDGAKSVSRRVTNVGELTAMILQLQAALGIGRPRRAHRLSFL